MEFTKERACAYIERYGEGESATEKQEIEAWAYLISSGELWNLNRQFIKRGTAVIESGVVSEDGEVNEDILKELHNVVW